MIRLPDPYENGPEYEGLMSRIKRAFKKRKPEPEAPKTTCEQVQELSAAFAECGAVTMNELREALGIRSPSAVLYADDEPVIIKWEG